VDDYLNVLALALLPAGGNFVGGVLSEVFRVSEKTLSLALHVAAGIVAAVVGIELMPGALKTGPAWAIVLAFIAGGGFFVLMDRFVDRLQERQGGKGQAGGAAWAIFFGVAVDLFSDGVMIGTGSTVAFSLGLLLALAQVPADVPEGFATIATFQKAGVPRARRFLLSAAFTLPILLGASVGYWLLRGQPEFYKMAMLAFTAGVLLSVVVEEMVKEAHRGEESRWAALALVGGFGLFAMITSYFGES
jgi:ZIP family zinc transporter